MDMDIISPPLFSARKRKLDPGMFINACVAFRVEKKELKCQTLQYISVPYILYRGWRWVDLRDVSGGV